MSGQAAGADQPRATSASTPQLKGTPQDTLEQANQAALSYLKQRPDADPIKQLLYATLHARRSLDRIDRSIKKDLHRSTPNAPDPLYFTPIGQNLAAEQTVIRRQLGFLAKQYISLGIEERQTRVIEDWSNILLPFVTALMDDPDLHLSRRQRDKVPMVVERHLRMLEAPRE